MAYVPPALRKKEEVTAESFPALTTETFPVLAKTSLKSFADKAKEWEEHRIQTENKVKMAERIKEHKIKLAAKAAEEDDYMASQFAGHRKKQVKPEVIQEPPKKVESEWTLVEKKFRKKKDFDYSDQPDNGSEDSFDCWNEQDNGSSWN